MAEYVELMAAGIEFDPAQAIEDEAGFIYVWDGSHRGAAARQLDVPLRLTIETGTEAEAEWLALSANQKHGLRRSQADKQFVVRQALLHSRGVQTSNREMARHCGVDHKTVGRIRAELEATGDMRPVQIPRRAICRRTSGCRSTCSRRRSGSMWGSGPTASRPGTPSSKGMLCCELMGATPAWP